MTSSIGKLCAGLPVCRPACVPLRPYTYFSCTRDSFVINSTIATCRCTGSTYPFKSMMLGIILCSCTGIRFSLLFLVSIHFYFLHLAYVLFPLYNAALST